MGVRIRNNESSPGVNRTNRKTKFRVRGIEKYLLRCILKTDLFLFWAELLWLS
jgi:hypothetical protein